MRAVKRERGIMVEKWKKLERVTNPKDEGVEHFTPCKRLRMKRRGARKRKETGKGFRQELKSRIEDKAWKNKHSKTEGGRQLSSGGSIMWGDKETRERQISFIRTQSPDL